MLGNMSNDYKIENEEFWFEPLDDFQLYGEIVVVEISEEDLINENTEGLKEKGSVDYGDWEELGTLLGKDDAALHQKYFEDEQLEGEWIVFLYTAGRYVTCIAG
ncbi:MAG: hypothetical protein CMP56_05150 [Flavobacteriales bacterium]|nr:hypothetical protein [Flavobacteriales bacterium]